MTSEVRHSSEYSEDILFRAQRLWGEGFLSPGGPSEVAHLVRGCGFEGKTVLDIGCGLGGVDLLLVKEHGVARLIALDIEPRLVEIAKASAMEASASDRIDFTRSGRIGLMQNRGGIGAARVRSGTRTRSCTCRKREGRRSV